MKPLHPRLGFSRRLSHSPSRTFAVSLLLLGLANFSPPATSAAADAAPVPAPLAIAGAMRAPFTLDRATLAAMPRTTIIAKDKSGADITYQGVELAELLKRAGAPLGEELRGPALSLAVLITASDAYAPCSPCQNSTPQ